MKYSRQTHFDFLESELKAQTNAFKKKLDTAAQYLLLKRGEMFVSQFLSFKDGEMILKFSVNRSMPRKGEFLYCMVLPKELRNYHNWGEMTYGDLVKQKAYFSEIVCIWHAKSSDPGYTIAGFRGVDIDFAEAISDANGIILVLGPNKPPYEYITNLQRVVKESADNESNLLDAEYIPHGWSPTLLDGKKSVSEFVQAQLTLSPTIILQGPPGTGKTYMIAELCRDFCKQGKSVLVTALTNRALMEIAEKKALANLVTDGKVMKTNLSVDEQHELPNLQRTKDLLPHKGVLMLSTFFITSGAADAAMPAFDYVIMDEASQALLAMFQVSRILGQRQVWIGDIKQLPPVVAISEDKINKRGYSQLVAGLNTLTECSAVPIYQLTDTYRLSKRATEFTKVFYNGNYFPKSTEVEDFQLGNSEISDILHAGGGPTLLKTELPIGEVAPKAALALAAIIVKKIYEQNKKINVAVLTCMVETAKQLQTAIFQTSGTHENLIVDTVARVQGLTTDVCVFVIPNTATFRSLEARLFNVATSRAKGYTLIITDKDIMECRMSKEVHAYLQKLEENFSFYYPIHESHNSQTIGCIL